MPLSLESRFLLDSLRVFIGGDPRSLDVGLAEHLNRDRLLSAAHFHGVVPLAYKIFCKLNPKYFPAPILEHFRQNVNGITLQSLQLTAEMLRLLNLLRAEGIPAVAFKGPTLSLQAYGDPFLRQFGDIDLLVRIKDFERVRSWMTSQGYTDTGLVSHACNFFHSERRVAVDLHRWIPGPIGFGGTESLTMDADSLLGRATYLTLQGHKIRTFQLDDLALALCIHGAKHAWRRWIWLFDIAALIVRNPSLDWNELTRKAHELGVAEPVYLSLRLTETVCGGTLPPEALRVFRVRPAIKELILPLHSVTVQDPNALRSDMRRYLLPFSTLNTSREKRVYLFWLLKRRITPNLADHNFLPLPPYLHFLYLIIRPLRLLYQYGSDVAGYAVLRLRKRRRLHNHVK